MVTNNFFCHYCYENSGSSPQELFNLINNANYYVVSDFVCGLQLCHWKNVESFSIYLFPSRYQDLSLVKRWFHHWKQIFFHWANSTCLQTRKSYYLNSENVVEEGAFLVDSLKFGKAARHVLILALSSYKSTSFFAKCVNFFFIFHIDCFFHRFQKTDAMYLFSNRSNCSLVSGVFLYRLSFWKKK